MTLSPEILQAEAFDRAARHVDAINCLVAAVRNGDPEGLARLGKRLLIGDRAPLKPVDAVGMLMEAVGKGHAEAPAILSPLFALGLHVRQDCQAAVDCLAQAAARGWPAARGQLRVLAADRDLAERTIGDDDPQLWKSLAGSVDWRAWLRPRQSLILHESPLIASYPDFIPGPVCNWLIEKARPGLQPAQVYDAVSHSVSVHSTRTNSSAIFNLADTDLVNVMLQLRMAACVAKPVRHFEAATVLHYAPGQAIAPHFDFIDPAVPDYERQVAQAGQRAITFLVYLNDDYQGGETSFTRLGIAHQGRRGEGLFFVNAADDGRPDTRTLHAGQPVVSGEKWIVSQFIRSRQFF